MTELASLYGKLTTLDKMSYTGKKLMKRTYVYKSLEQLGFRIRKLRNDRSLSRQAVSNATGVLYQTLVRLESGESRNPRVSTIVILSNYFGVSVNWLVFGTDTPDLCTLSGE